MEQELVLNICDFAKEAKGHYRDGKTDKCLELMKQFLVSVREFEENQVIFDECIDMFHIALLLKNNELISSIINLLEKMAKKLNSNEAMTKYLCVKIKYAETVNAVEMLENLYDEFYKLKKIQIQDVNTLKVRNIKSKISIKQEILERKKYILEVEQRKKQAETDQLTKLPNRYRLRNFCKELFPRARAEGSEIGIIEVDIDGYSAIRECYGKQGCERCLKVVAESISSCSDGQFCARFGEDDFLIVTYALTREQVYDIAKRINRSVEEKKISQATSQKSEFVSVSQGIVFGIPMVSEVEKYWNAVDMAMIQGKKKKNSITIGRLPAFSE